MPYRSRQSAARIILPSDKGYEMWFAIGDVDKCVEASDLAAEKSPPKCVTCMCFE